MENQFVPHEYAVKLKTIGFKERVHTYYEDGKLKLYNDILGWDFNSSFTTCYSAPTWQQVFDWFRTYYKVDNWLIPYAAGYTYLISDKPGRPTPSELFIQYEEAREACLEKLIDLALKG